MQNKIAEMKDVILYGAAIQNLRFAYDIIEPTDYNVKFIVDRDSKKQGKQFYNISVISPEDLRKYDCEHERYYVVITVRSEHIIDEIKQQLSDLKNAKVLTIAEFNYEADINHKIKEINYFVCHLVDHCNLNCVRCSHFSPLAKEPTYLDKVEFREDLVKLRELLGDTLCEIQLGGGEPLLHPECSSFFEIVRSIFPDTRIVLLTNGLLLKRMSNSFYEACKLNRVLLNITIYDTGMDYSELSQFLDKKEIEFKIGDEGDFNRRTGKQMEKPVSFLLKNTVDGEDSFRRCYIGKCFVLRHGKLYFCNYAAYSDLFNRFFETNLPQLSKNGVDIYGVKSKDELISKMMRKCPLCDHCIPAQSNNGIPWAISKQEMSEWAETN